MLIYRLLDLTHSQMTLRFKARAMTDHESYCVRQVKPFEDSKPLFRASYGSHPLSIDVCVVLIL